MSRRFWIGTPKGQNTTAETFFNTTRSTIYQVNTSAPTTYPSFFDTFYNTLVPTGYIINTTYVVNTSYTTNYFYDVVTSHPTADTRITQYYDPGFLTTYIQNTITSYDTVFFSDFVPTTKLTTMPVYINTARFTTVTEPTTVELRRDTDYIYPVPAYTTTYQTFSPTSSSFSSNEIGCYYYNANGSPAGDTGVPAGCSVVSCSPFSESYATGSAPTSYLTSTTTSGVTTFLTHIEDLRNTTVTVIINGQTDPDNGVFDCYPDSDPGVVAYCQDVNARCEPCQIFDSQTVQTDYGYDVVTSSPAPITTSYFTTALTTVTYLQEQCFSCSLSCVTSFPTFFPTSAFVPATNTTVSQSTIYAYTTYPTTYDIITEFDTFIGNTTFPYPGLTDYPTSVPTTALTTTTYQQYTGGFFYPVTTEYTRVTSYPTAYPTSQTTNNDTLYPTDVATTVDTEVQTSNQTQQDTTVITSWLTDTPQNTTVLTSRTTTFFTQ